ncbi:DNA-directed RNA polymerase subunit H [archaeon]|nr:DNA-directed RNA polymerase subunit H [archaeon]|tara:strand:- start:4577 stop:4819 length:243 start_codon:yes stop_codon:yes gene_type:complete
MKKKVIIKNHILIPDHTKLTKKEVDDVVKKYNVSTRQFPSISKKDPAIDSLDVEPGDVIKIKRKSFTDNDTIFYRVVIDE